MHLTNLVACRSLLRGRTNERSAPLVFVAHLISRARCPGRLPRLRSGEWQQHAQAGPSATVSAPNRNEAKSERAGASLDADGQARVRRALQTSASLSARVRVVRVCTPPPSTCTHTIRANRGDLRCAAGRRHPLASDLSPPFFVSCPRKNSMFFSFLFFRPFFVREAPPTPRFAITNCC